MPERALSMGELRSPLVFVGRTISAVLLDGGADADVPKAFIHPSMQPPDSFTWDDADFPEIGWALYAVICCEYTLSC